MFGRWTDELQGVLVCWNCFCDPRILYKEKECSLVQRAKFADVPSRRCRAYYCILFKLKVKECNWSYSQTSQNNNSRKTHPSLSFSAITIRSWLLHSKHPATLLPPTHASRLPVAFQPFPLLSSRPLMTSIWTWTHLRFPNTKGRWWSLTRL